MKFLYALGLLIIGMSGTTYSQVPYVFQQPAIYPENIFQTDLVKENLKGAVKNCVENWYSYVTEDGASSIKKWESEQKKRYNKYGNVLSSYSDYSYRNKHHRNTTNYFYDSHNRLTITGKDRIHSERISKYGRNNHGQLTEDISFHSGLTFHVVYKKSGERDSVYRYEKSKLIEIDIYKADRNDNVIEGIYKNSDLPVNHLFFWKYDKYHRIIEHISVNVDGKHKRKTNYVYDLRGNITIRTDSNAYDLGLGDTNYSDVGPYNYYLKYSFIDAKGNWLQRDEVFNGHIVYTDQRKITYYK